MIELLLLLPGFIHEKSRREREPKAILVVSRNFMHWKSSFLLHSEEAALKISEPAAEAKAQTNQYNCKSNAVASFSFFNSISERQSKKTNPFLFAFPPERTVFTFRLFRGVGKELRLWQVDCPVKSWLRVLSVNECQALSA